MEHPISWRRATAVIKTKTITFVYCCLVVFFSFPSLGQELKPKSIASPEIASLGRFGEIPVGGYTGVPDISIPLYTIENDGVQVPIVLRYHASGIRVEQEATWVGLGWDLTVGGSLTQIISGAPDQQNVVPFENATFNGLTALGNHIDSIPMSPFKAQSFCHADNLCPNGTMNLTGIITLRDNSWASIDRYTFSIPSGGGEFYIDPISHAIKAVGNKRGEYFIQQTPTTQGTRVAWTIRDISGNVYYFNDHDYEYSAAEVGDVGNFNGYTSKLSYIKSENGSLIEFRYVDAEFTSGTYTENASRNFFESGQNDGPKQSIYDNVFAVKYLSEVETEKEKIVFELSSNVADRTDLPGAKRINAIHIWDKFRKVKIKSLFFQYDYFTSNLSYKSKKTVVTDQLTKRLKLLSVKQVGYKADGSQEEGAVHAFEYNGTNLPRKDSYARDHWGLFNGQNNSSFLPDLSDEILSGIFHNYKPQVGSGGTDVTPDHVLKWFMDNGSANKGMSGEHAKAGILTKLIHPTKGFTEFEYEPHTYQNYRTYSAQENNDDVGRNDTSIVDKNINGEPVRSALLAPDEGGHLTIRNFSAAFVRVDSTISYDKFQNCWARLYKVGSDEPIWHWNMITDGHGGYTSWSSEPRSFHILGQPEDRYYAEIYLDNIPELSSGTSSIPRVLGVIRFIHQSSTMDRLSEESIGGGLRVKRVISTDGLTGNVLRKHYRYVKADGVSTSGKLMSPIRNYVFTRHVYGATLLPVDIVQLASFSYVPLGNDAQGAPVGYDRVEIVSEGGDDNDLGATVTYYRNRPSSVFPYSSFGSFSRSIPNVPYFDNGLEDSVVVFNSVGDRIKKTMYTHRTLENKVSYSIMVFDKLYGASVTNSNCGCDGVDWEPDQFDKWLAVFYPMKTLWYAPASIDEVTYNNSYNKLTATTCFSYNQFGQRTQTKTSTSEKVFHVLTEKFPIDDVSGSPLVQQIKDRKRFDLVLEQSETLDGRPVSKKINGYEAGDDRIILNEVKRSFQGGPMINDVSDIRYDRRDNILGYKQNGIQTTFIWGYNNIYPIAKIVNAGMSLSNAYVDGSKILKVIKVDAPTQPTYHVDFSIGKSGNVSFNIGMSESAPNQNEDARVRCQVTGITGNGVQFDHMFELCLATGTFTSACEANGLGVTLNMDPGNYTLAATMTYENNVAVTKGRTISINFADFNVNIIDPEYYFENFEEENEGTVGDAFTGRKYGSGNVVEWSRPNNRTYVISYWYKVNGVWRFSDRKPYTANNFTMVQAEAYDDIRIHPRDAEMTTFTYDPLVGMTSQSDPSGITTFYDYDALGRLELVRDHEGNIIKNYKYHYKQ